jgi:hypothetical protein
MPLTFVEQTPRLRAAPSRALRILLNCRGAGEAPGAGRGPAPPQNAAKWET